MSTLIVENESNTLIRDEVVENPIETLRALENFDESQELGIENGAGVVQSDSLSLNKDGSILVSTVAPNTAHLYNKNNNAFEYSHTFDVLDVNSRGSAQELSLNGRRFLTSSWGSVPIRILSRPSTSDNFGSDFIDFDTSHFDGIGDHVSSGSTFIGDDGEHLLVFFIRLNSYAYTLELVTIM